MSLLFMFVFMQQNIYAQHKNNLENKVGVVEIEAFDLSVALQKIALLYDTVIGFESLRKDKSAKQSIHLTNATLQDTLDLVVLRSNPAYSWKISDGVVSVYPTIEKDAVLESLLATRIDCVSFDGEFSKIGVRNYLTDLSELKTEMGKNSVKPLNLEFFSTRTQAPFYLQLYEKNITFREILNKVAYSSRTNFWIASRYGKKEEFFIINF